MSGKSIVEFEELVLLAVCMLDGTGYGISVKKEVRQKMLGRIPQLTD